MTSSPSENDIIEHVVLFNVKEEEDDYPTKVNDMVNDLNSLNSLDSVIYLTAGPILRTRSSPLKFTHMLHGRYRTVSDLETYAVDPTHVAVVENLVRPLCDDVMAVDWSANLGAGDHVIVPRPGSAMRVSLLQVEGEDIKESFLEGVRKIKEVMEPYEQISYGENFSDRAKGYSVATLVIFPDLNELDSSEEYEDRMRSLVDKVKGNSDDDGYIVIDYVVPRISVLNSNLD